VISQSGAKRAILVTSHYTNPTLREGIVKLKAKMLPKQLAAVVPMHLMAVEKISTELKQVDGVWLEDSTELTKMLSLCIEAQIDYYNTPDDFMEHIHQYPKDVYIMLDHNFDPPYNTMTGLEIAEKLHQAGYIHLLLTTGQHFSPGSIPDYITVVPKREAVNIKNYWVS
jgi:hypothetical protein